MVTDAKKLQLIKQITEIEDQTLVDQLEQILHSSYQRTVLAAITSPIQQEFDLEKIKEAQNFRPIDKEEFNRLVQEADIQEPIEDLLEMLKS